MPKTNKKIYTHDNETIVYSFKDLDFQKKDEMQDNIDFIITYIVDLFKQNLDNNFQRNFFKNSIKELFKEFEKQHPEHFETTKTKIIQTLLEKIQVSQDMFYMFLIEDFIEKDKFNPLLTPSFESFNSDANKEYLYHKNDHLKPVVMKLLSHSKTDLSFVLSYLKFFNTDIKSKPEILFGKEIFSNNNILFKPKKYSVNSWWEPIHFNKYEINDFNEINQEDFIKEQKDKYYDLLKKNTGVEADGLLKSLLDICLHNNLEQLYKDNALSYASDNTQTPEELNNLFINSLLNHIDDKNENDHSIEEKIKVEEEFFNYHSIEEESVIREIIMLEIFSKFSKNDIDSVKEQLQELNLYPDSNELKQMLFIMMNSSFSGRNGPEDLIPSYYDIIISELKIKNQIIPYFSNFRESEYSNGDLQIIIEKKLPLSQDEFEQWFNQYTYSFSMKNDYMRDKNDALKTFYKKMNLYLDNIFKMSEISQYMIPIADIEEKMSNEIVNTMEKCLENHFSLQRNEIDTLKLQAKIDSYSIKMSLQNPFEPEIKNKKRF